MSLSAGFLLVDTVTRKSRRAANPAAAISLAAWASPPITADLATKSAKLLDMNSSYASSEAPPPPPPPPPPPAAGAAALLPISDSVGAGRQQWPGRGRADGDGGAGHARGHGRFLEPRSHALQPSHKGIKVGHCSVLCARGEDASSHVGRLGAGVGACDSPPHAPRLRRARVHGERECQEVGGPSSGRKRRARVRPRPLPPIRSRNIRAGVGRCEASGAGKARRGSPDDVRFYALPPFLLPPWRFWRSRSSWRSLFSALASASAAASSSSSTGPWTGARLAQSVSSGGTG